MRHVLEFQKFGVEIPMFAESYVRSLLQNLLAHDPVTQAHCVRVSQMALSVAQKMELNLLEQAVCMYSGLLHDVGKIKIPLEILNKPGKLTDDEYAIVKRHTEYGVELIGSLTVLPFFKKNNPKYKVSRTGYQEVAQKIGEQYMRKEFEKRKILHRTAVEFLGKTAVHHRGEST